MNYRPTHTSSPGFPAADQCAVSYPPRQIARVAALGMAGSLAMNTASPRLSHLSEPAVGMTPTPYGLGIHDGYAPPVKLAENVGPYPRAVHGRSVVNTVLSRQAALLPSVVIAVLRGLSQGKSTGQIAVEQIDAKNTPTEIAQALRIVYGTTQLTGISPQDLLVMAEQNRPPRAMFQVAKQLLTSEQWKQWEQQTSAPPTSPQIDAPALDAVQSEQAAAATEAAASDMAAVAAAAQVADMEAADMAAASNMAAVAAAAQVADMAAADMAAADIAAADTAAADMAAAMAAAASAEEQPAQTKKRASMVPVILTVAAAYWLLS